MTQVPLQARPSDGCPVPPFAPVRVRAGRPRLRRLLRHRRRALAVGLAMTAAALATTGPRDSDEPRAPAAAEQARGRPAAETVTAPVRIADAAAAALLRPGDRVDVIAAEGPPGSGAKPRVVAAGARVSEVPEQAEGPAESGALVVLSVPRDTASRLAGAGASTRLAVTLR
ncbi:MULTISPECIES: RcpC/CpaB family pilus assembly protein [Streptomyces]|uniref:RcpC/CpaB family pilus assembly protein n=1 Tax=Streptomyces TaxID=1883 RepID=UPI001E3E448F|nr:MULTISPECIES: RcpC/CpaB family pilus assembly protein [Streptomyces]UFQ16183.1 RcpC/CpaB family pilus assembly protein [Streptomyces huasconensis]WCL85787.1 RcpC/CpaB family pilus assembly protein [Streptomyces sp. JCM 35825]